MPTMGTSTGKDLTVTAPDRPGQLAKAAEAIADAGINIDGFCATTSDGKGTFHVLTKDPAGTRRALQGAGFEVREERDVVIVEAEDRPGEAAKALRKIADQEINIALAYSITKDRFALGAADIAKVREALESEAPATTRRK
ncbi:MAG: ACT domain-containing protein [Candidatus Limnocylindria bacterium]